MYLAYAIATYSLTCSSRGIITLGEPRSWVHHVCFLVRFPSSDTNSCPSAPILSYPLALCRAPPRQLAPTVGLSGAVWIKFGWDLFQLNPGTQLQPRPRVFSSLPSQK